MTVSITIVNKKEVMKFLEGKRDTLLNLATQGVAKAALHMQNEVKLSIAGQRSEPTSVDTGRFLNSISFNVFNKQATVFTDIEYAKFLEYGTSRMAARYHFGNSLARNQDKIKELILSEINI